jgi:Blt1 N-terminal domain
MTAEVTFAKSFLSTLESRAVKLQADHAADQRTIQPRGAVSFLIYIMAIDALKAAVYASKDAQCYESSAAPVSARRGSKHRCSY